MRYKAIAAGFGAASPLAMGTIAADSSVESSHGIDGAGMTVTRGPDPTTMTSASFAPVVKATPAWGFMSQCFVLIEFGDGLHTSAYGDGDLIHHCRETGRTNRPRPHHDPYRASTPNQKPIVALRVGSRDIATDSLRP
jgi:hypothetical protein